MQNCFKVLGLTVRKRIEINLFSLNPPKLFTLRTGPSLKDKKYFLGYILPIQFCLGTFADFPFEG